MNLRPYFIIYSNPNLYNHIDREKRFASTCKNCMANPFRRIPTDSILFPGVVPFRYKTPDCSLAAYSIPVSMVFKTIYHTMG